MQLGLLPSTCGRSGRRRMAARTGEANVKSLPRALFNALRRARSQGTAASICRVEWSWMIPAIHAAAEGRPKPVPHAQRVTQPRSSPPSSPCIPQPMSLSLHAYLVSLVTDRQLDTSKTEGGGQTKSNGDQSCIVTSVSQDNLSRENECVRAREGVRRDTCYLTAGHREANSLSRMRSRVLVMSRSGKDIECGVKCAVISLQIPLKMLSSPVSSLGGQRGQNSEKELCRGGMRKLR